jgi:RNA-directed DNA polymerase
MHDQGKSDPSIVPRKRPNKPGRPSAEAVEGRGGAEGTARQQSTGRTQSRETVSQTLACVREAAKRSRRERFTSLMHHVTPDLLAWAFQQLKRQAAPGVDGVTWEQYAAALDDNIDDLHGRIMRGAYRAKPSRRQYIPKPDGRQRPLGIAALEDKVVQRAMVEVLNAIYEVDFLGFSYGFRPGRSQHDALDALAYGINFKKVNWILDADIRSFFDCISHDWMMRFLEYRIGDRRVLRLIAKWLKAGVMEEGSWTEGTIGTPQGAVISPLLANVYLHYVYDLWVDQWRRRTATGPMIVVRYADDTIVGFQRRADADRFLRDLRARLASFSLDLHPDKTRLIEFGRFAAQRRSAKGLPKPETFDFLGFTHICGESADGRSC